MPEKRLTITPFFDSIFLLLLLFSATTHANDWIYTIKPGDNLWNLSEKYLQNFTQVQKLQRLNHITDPWHLQPGSTIKIPEPWLKKSPALARIRTLQGVVEIIDTKGRNPARPHSLLSTGDSIHTGENSTAIIEFIDGSSVSLQANSHLTINHLGLYENTGMTNTRIYLEKGRLETQVAPKKGSASRFEITTPTAVTSVRGTDYRIGAKTADSKTEVLGGQVSVQGHDKEQLVKTGFGLISFRERPTPPPVKLLDAPDIANIPTLFEQIPIQFTLPLASGTRGHRLQMAMDETFAAIILDQVFSGKIIRGPNQLADGSYRMRIRAIDAQGLEGYDTETGFVLNAQPEAPFLLKPKSEASVVEESPIFEWAKRENIEHYHFQLADKPDFSKLIVDLDHFNDVQLVLAKKLQLGKYYWRVAAIDKVEGAGPFSDGQMFRRVLPGPQAEAPEIGEDGIVIRFRAGLPEQKYHFQLAEDEDFSNILIDKQATEPVFKIEKLSSGDYFIRARTIDPDGFTGPFSSAQMIEIPIEGLYWLLLLPLLALIAL